MKGTDIVTSKAPDGVRNANYLNEIRESSTEHDGVTTAATTLTPAGPEQGQDPGREKHQPDLRGHKRSLWVRELTI